MTETVLSLGRGGTAAAMAQYEQMTEEHSTLEQQSPGRLDPRVVRRVDGMTSVDVEALRRRWREPMGSTSYIRSVTVEWQKLPAANFFYGTGKRPDIVEITLFVADLS